MALVLADRVQETTTTTGTGTVTLAGAATGFQAFSVIGDGNTTYYAIVDDANSAWEVGIGTYTAAGTLLSRDTVLESSNAGALVSFAAGTKDVFVTYPAEKAISDGYGTLPVANGGTGAINATDARLNLSAAKSGANSDITSLSGITGSISSPTDIQMGSGSATTLAAGRMWYNELTGSLNFGMGGGNITQQVGEELFRYGKASAAITDSPLQLVYKTGKVGASSAVTFAPAVAGILDGDQILGLATEDIALNGFGRITTYGIINNINTTGASEGETWADDDDIYYNPVTGGLTKTIPVAPNLKLFVGTVINAGSGGAGSFIVKIGDNAKLSELSDVQLTSPINGNVVVYDAALGYWRNNTLTAGTNVSIANGNGSITINSTDQFSGTVTSVGGTGAVSGLTLTGTVTSAGNLTLGGAITGFLPLTGGTLTGSLATTGLVLNDGYTEEVFVITDGATVNLDPDNGSIQTWTLGANRTPGQANWDAGQSITLMVDDGTAYAITWSTLAVVWTTDAGVAPTLNTSGFTTIVLWKVSTTIYGARVGYA